MKRNLIISVSLFILLVIIILIITFNVKHKNEGDKQMENINNISVIINDKKYSATILDNETAQKFVSKLPQEFEMEELNGNEKYVYMDYSLPTDEKNPEYIQIGDIMLYNNNCLVIFYKSFITNYRYTKIGPIDTLDDLGNDNIIVRFEKN